MFGCQDFVSCFEWWIFPVIMIVMMVLCFFVMRGHIGSMMCCSGHRKPGKDVGSSQIGRRKNEAYLCILQDKVVERTG